MDIVGIDFQERITPMDEIRDALIMSRDLLKFGIEENNVKAMEMVQSVFPKLRLGWLSMERYNFASRFMRDGDFVLDVPCGTGYGASILASSGNKVYGMDIDESTIAMASDVYRYPNIEFFVGDMMRDDLPEVDFITCLDGLEHVSPGRELIERFVEVLSDTGVLVVSVPINELAITGGVANPYHEEDYDYEKLKGLLEEYFGTVNIYGHDLSGSISDASNAFDGITAVCEV